MKAEDTLKIFVMGLMQGRRQVVEFIRNEIAVETKDEGIFINGFIAGEKWQAKLEEWGIGKLAKS